MFSVTAAGEKRAYKFLARWAYLCCVFVACAQQTPSCDCLTEGLSSVYLSFLHPGMRRNGTSGSTQSGAKSQISRLFLWLPDSLLFF